MKPLKLFFKTLKMIILGWFFKHSEMEDYLTKVVYVIAVTVIQHYDSTRDKTKQIIISPPGAR